MLWSDNMVIPVGAPNPTAALGVHGLRLRPRGSRPTSRSTCTTCSPVDGVKEILTERDPKLANNQLIFPDDEFTADCTTQPVAGRRAADHGGVPGGVDGLTAVERDGGWRHHEPAAGSSPTSCSRPGLLWLILFFVVPMYFMGRLSLDVGHAPPSGFQFAWNWSQLPRRADAATTRSSSARSSTPGIATLLALLIAYPLAYAIAFRGGRWKNAAAVRRHRAVLHHLPDPDAGLADDPLRREPRRRRR